MIDHETRMRTRKALRFLHALLAEPYTPNIGTSTGAFWRNLATNIGEKPPSAQTITMIVTMYEEFSQAYYTHQKAEANNVR